MVFSRRETAILAAGDFLVLCASLWFALLARSFSVPGTERFMQLFVPFLPIFGLSLIVFYVAGLYEKQTLPVRRVMGARVVGAQIANTVLAALLFFVLQLSIAPKTILALYLVISVFSIAAWRFYRMTRERASGERIPAVLVGEGPAVEEVLAEVAGNDRYLVRFSAHLAPSACPDREALLARTREAIDAGAKLLVLDTHNERVERELPLVYAAFFRGVVPTDFVSFYEQLFDRVPLDHVDYAWLLPNLPVGKTPYDVGKRAVDIIAALCGLVLAAPFVLLAALLLAPTGAPFLQNERVGQGGRTFRMLKLRTMLFDDKGDPELRAKNRITPLGSFLRKSRIDELPQLWNVLMGDVSFIGPRPELPAIVSVYEREIPFYEARHSIQPGLSGWAQMHNHHDAPKGGPDVLKTREKLSYDLYYLKHRSFGLDMAIMLKTLRALAAFSGK
jgi:lipopolysaccharide/colanic/teichoic acid biosynthesis glycosyltransferase